MASLKNRSFTNLADKDDDVLGGFCYGALETWKIKGKTSNNGKFDFKGKIKHQQKDGQLSGNLSDEVKIQFPYGRNYFWLGTRAGKAARDLKVHVDFGEVELGGRKYNLFSNLKTQVNFKSFAWRLGANHFGTKFTSSARLESDCSNAGNAWGLTTRVHFKQDDLFYGLVSSLGLGNGLQFRRLDTIVGYQKNDTNLYLEHFAASIKNKLALGNVVATATYKKDNVNYGLEVSNDFQRKSINAALAVGSHSRDNGVTTKGKLNKNLDVELSYKKKVSDQISVHASGKLALAKGKGVVDFSQYVPIPFGVEVEVNI